ncbi:MAG: beta-ketoacyl-[acyl-carrier-protein] synthase II [candidate division Zixibacteria bacterium RBG_16_48_11]|nr:MAG: beta-ketoacyl-[acyl-carrier-protein] synthase II [candidate division Zixibacteria bacterium RBG_16_48_11]
MKNRVVITGMGVISPIGNDLSSFWEGLKSGKSGVGTVSRFEPVGMTTKIAAEVKGFDASPLIEKKELRRMDLVEQYAIISAQQAVDDARLDFDSLDLERVGVITGSGIGGIDTFEKQHQIFLKSGPSKVSPFFIPMMIIDMCPGLISLRFGIKGPNYATVSACASSAHAIADAFRVIQRGEADVMISGGAEATITPVSFAGFCSARAMSTRNDSPTAASRPFDKDRDGFVMGEGGAMIILESLEYAKKRGARIYAELLGVGMSADAYHITAPAPDGNGAFRSMKNALVDAGLKPEQVDYVNAHGTSTELGDASETRAVKNVFGQHAYKLAVNSTKSMIGHLLGAAGAAELVTCVLSLRDGILHPTINLDQPSPECDLDYVPKQSRQADLKVAISNSFGFGGHNITLIAGIYSE